MANEYMTNKFFEDHSLIKPPELGKTSDTSRKYYRYIIDSRDRNLAHFPSPNKYQLKLTEDITDVESVELVSYDIPFAQYMIKEGHNTFEVLHTDGARHTVSIKPGDYKLTQLVDFLNDAFQNILEFASNAVERKLEIRSLTTPGKILCAGPLIKKNDYETPSPTYASSLYKILGLPPTDFDFTTSDFTSFPYIIDNRTAKYMIMNLGQTSLNFSENITTNSSFAVIMKDNFDDKFLDSNGAGKYMHKSPYIKYYNPPIASLKTLNIEFVDYNGDLYDFQNQDHLVELLFTCYKNQRKYSDIYQN